MKTDHVYRTRTAANPTDGAAEPTAPNQKRRWWNRKWGWEVLLVVYAAYDGSRLLVNGKRTQALQHGDSILKLERQLHLSPELSLNHFFAAHAWIGVPADFIYATLHYIITVVVLFWVWRYHRDHYRHARTWLGLTTVLGVIGFVTFPTAPPRLLGSSYGFVDLLVEHASVGWWGGGGGGGTPRGLADMTNEYAAMPSLHVGWSLWCGLLVFMYARHRAVRWAALCYPVIIAFVVMGTANHYLLDCVFGAAVSLFSLAVTKPLLKLSDRVGLLVRRGLRALFRRRARA
ncbi:phosphatase PAP2 family protein [Streptacidiphilus albus]|uniref:phosphatase PAP2 family protein n=1 Tax=Streptacidiphilus albus TaxID=105425 RepID=UPI0006920575|nr:phosphatase PAP2 family protein [Streptacidiphilus albus]